MIELCGVKKSYFSKKGTSTDALKGVNLKLPDKGLVFILGKSGSGKSTLLNILGGLDTYSDGEIIVNGKSTKEFKQKDWDAYRNTYVGFVFQEYNLLDNYSIEDNIKLSLELQHKKVNSLDVLNILKEVDLADILKRKPNELSGGQKQRVAIARALIKKPEIILADEPTGNLDSATSEQIFGILKKLSKKNLVVIVSHDEESANKYADRIVRIADGVIVDDTNTKDIAFKKELNLVGAKLPFWYSFKMGIGNLFSKKFRFFFSVLLILLCLICFGVMLSTSNTDVESNLLEKFMELGSMDVYIKKYDGVFNFDLIDSDGFKLLELSDSDIADIEKNTNLNWNKEYTLFDINGEEVHFIYSSDSKDSSPIYYDSSSYNNIALLNDELNASLDIIGNLPINDDEVLISSYIADLIIYFGVDSKDNKNDVNSLNYQPTSYEQLINDGKYINLGNLMYVKVVGIVDCSEELSKYSELKNISYATFDDYSKYDEEKYEEIFALQSDFSMSYSYGKAGRIYVTSALVEKLEKIENNVSLSTIKIEYNNNLFDVFQFGYINSEMNVINKDGTVKVYTIENNEEIIINTAVLNIITNGDYENKYFEYLESYSEGNEEDFLKNYLNNNDIIGKEVKTSINDGKIYSDISNYKEYRIIGVVIDNNEDGIIYYNENIVSGLMVDALFLDNVYTTVNDEETMKMILEYYPCIDSSIVSGSKYVWGFFDSVLITNVFCTIGKYGSIFFLFFSMIMLINFVGNSIRFRRKEIGILRAIGCRGVDIIKMFVYECIALIIVCLALSFAILPLIVNLLNNMIYEVNYRVSTNVFNFGLQQILILTLIMVVMMFLASVIPLIKLTRKKPIDTILEK